MKLLAGKRLGFGELQERSGLSPRGLNEILKVLQGRGLVKRDFRGRKYFADVKYATEALFLNEAATFMLKPEPEVRRSVVILKTDERELGITAELVTESKGEEKVDAFFSRTTPEGSEQNSQWTGALLMLQQYYAAAWIKQRFQAATKAPEAAEYILTLSKYMRECGLELPKRAWASYLAYTPKLSFSHDLPADEDKLFMDVLFDMVEFAMVRRTAEKKMPGFMGYVDNVLKCMPKSERGKEFRTKLKVKAAKKLCEEFILDCVPPKGLLVVPLAGFESINLGVADLYDQGVIPRPQSE